MEHEREQAKELLSDEEVLRRLLSKPEVRARIEDARKRSREGREQIIADNARFLAELRRGRT